MNQNKLIIHNCLDKEPIVVGENDFYDIIVSTLDDWKFVLCGIWAAGTITDDIDLEFEGKHFTWDGDTMDWKEVK